MNIGRLGRQMLWIGCLVAAGFSPVLSAADPAPLAHKKGHKTKPAAAKVNGLAQAAANAGVVDCIGRIQQVSDFLTSTGGKSGAFLFVAPTDANQHLASSSFEVQTGGASTYASASFAPNGQGGCGALYETVAYWGNRCDEVAASAFAGFTPAGKLSDSIIMLAGAPSVRVFLLPAGHGCLSIKKEVIY